LLLRQLAGEAAGLVSRRKEGRGNAEGAAILCGAEGGESERGEWVVMCPNDSHPSSSYDWSSLYYISIEIM
jgi:hypothetical protein